MRLNVQSIVIALFASLLLVPLPPVEAYSSKAPANHSGRKHHKKRSDTAATHRTSSAPSPRHEGGSHHRNGKDLPGLGSEGGDPLSVVEQGRSAHQRSTTATRSRKHHQADQPTVSDGSSH
jgi:hypothetical protein